jgi:Mg2+/Co2+ transporter CorC
VSPTVVDDYGKIAGLVTLEDLMEDSSGRLLTSTTSRNPSSGPHGDHTAQVSARIRIDELKPLLGIDLPAGDRDTPLVCCTRCTGTSQAPTRPRPVAVTRCGPNACGAPA